MSFAGEQVGAYERGVEPYGIQGGGWVVRRGRGWRGRRGAVASLGGQQEPYEGEQGGLAESGESQAEAQRHGGALPGRGSGG
ncbi:hypothetical protein TU94_17780 [Streptomyces cyaneogriseus subsp. noncyanogenus]|uniref:Uncharacterized protein n=1 Tax=Streptomyces cyaneogriseus subsp. noncyanogenus TaxID=477245 RepID=A0A0C5G4D0_9ACTN|nr:hypothetical protein TU94_17780 [Streptomyces cyaneogriseus subsp. noncyanogenus]